MEEWMRSTCRFALAVMIFSIFSFLFKSNVIAQPTTQPTNGKTALDFVVKDIDGKDVNLADYKGKVVMIVNVASKCGLTPQYKALEELYEKNKDRGFVVLHVIYVVLITISVGR